MTDLYTAAFSVLGAADNYKEPWISFPKLGITFEGVEESISIGGFDIAWYGIIICFGMLICMILGMINCKCIDLSRDHLTDYLLAAIPSAIVGARFYYVIFEWKNYKDNLLSAFDIRSGGLAIYGGIIGAAIAIIIMAKIRKHAVLDLLDFAMPHIFLGQAIGRWGNFINQEAFGSTTDLPWGMTGSEIGSMPVHPTFLYESLWCFIGFAVLYTYMMKFRKGKGEVLALYFFIYGIERAFVEGLRTDSLYLGGIRVSQLLSIALVIISVPFFIDCRKRYNKKSVLNVSPDEVRTNLSDLADEIRAEENGESESETDTECESAEFSDEECENIEDNNDSADNVKE